MTYNEFMYVIVNSQPDDWLYDDSKQLFVFKNDILISIKEDEVSYDEDGRFHEDWAESFPDPNARKAQFELCYSGNEIESFYTVMVDGARMYIPYPKINGMTITNKQYAIGKIVNVMNEAYGFDSYLTQAGISVK